MSFFHVMMLIRKVFINQQCCDYFTALNPSCFWLMNGHDMLFRKIVIVRFLYVIMLFFKVFIFHSLSKYVRFTLRTTHSVKGVKLCFIFIVSSFRRSFYLEYYSYCKIYESFYKYIIKCTIKRLRLWISFSKKKILLLEILLKMLSKSDNSHWIINKHDTFDLGSY